MAAVSSFDRLAADIQRHPGPVRLVGVDGLAGAGKTTFAARLAAAGGGWPVVHTDDFASHDEPMEWGPRMLAEVVEPLLRGEAAAFRPYDWVRRRRTGRTVIPPSSVVVIEGVGATRTAWRDRLALRIWIEVPRPVRRMRGVARDGMELAGFWDDWMAVEDRYAAAERPSSYADLRIDGDPSVPHDAQREFVVL